MTAHVITFHSFLRGTGKTTLAAQIGRLLSADARVALVDGDLTTPSLSQLLGMPTQPGHTLNDYLKGLCRLSDTALRVPASPQQPVASEAGQLFLIACDDQPDNLSRMARATVPFDELAVGLHELAAALNLDLILLDAAAGLSGLTLPQLAVADEVALVMRLDQEDYQGTGVTLEVVRRLGVQQVRLLVNMVPDTYDLEGVEEKVGSTYQAPVTALSLFPPEPERVLGDLSALRTVGRQLYANKRPGPEEPKL